MAVPIHSQAFAALLKMAALLQFDRPQLASFSLALSDTHDFECIEIVRCVPGKRLVCRGSWNGQPVYAKLFIGQGASRYAKRDRDGVRALATANILTPPLLHAGGIDQHSGEILIFGEVAQSIDAEQALDGLQSAHERLRLAQSLIREGARHHNAGLIQHDLYLKNFLFDSSRVIYTLDGDGIRPLSALFPKKQALHNLAALLSKFDVAEEVGWLPELLQLYAQERGWNTPIDSRQMQKRVAAHRRRVVRGYADRKVFRQCSDVAVEKNWCSFTAFSRQYAAEGLKDTLSAPDRLLDEPSSLRLKSGNTCTVSLIEVCGRRIVVKRYNIKDMWHALGRMFRPSRAAVSWANAHRLQMYGIATAAPLAIREQRFGPLRFKAWFLAEYIDAPDIAGVMESETASLDQKLKVATNVARLLYKMRLLQIAHGDLKASNIHVVDAQPILIDLDSLHEYRSRAIFEIRHISDLRRLLRNWQAKPEIYALVENALKMVYGDDPILARAGI